MKSIKERFEEKFQPITDQELRLMFGLHESTIERAKNGRTWKHLTQEATRRAEASLR